ncbi:MAG: thiamine diphosphokinase [Bacteroides sp.]|nr:thiamine diphosphokinase [Prevotella sp.]MCM1407589.1 thiamine diphosphokinase [Treponema brennaborense]MCM1469261.1 thiamine diphosphokinase [Bacteroides sp.]
MSGKTCYIFGAGENYTGTVSPDAADYVIAVDGGYKYVWEHRIAPDLIIGDFDSFYDIATDAMRRSFEKHPFVIKLPAEKDDTDMYVAVKYGIQNGCTRFLLYGGTGGRISHTMANIQCLVMLARCGMRGYLYAPEYMHGGVSVGEVMTVIHNSKICFSPESKGFISVFSLDAECSGVCETGLKYGLSDYTLLNNYPVGVSNEFTGCRSEISVASGSLLVVYTTAAREQEI